MCWWLEEVAELHATRGDLLKMEEHRCGLRWPWSDTGRIRAAFLHRLELILRVPQSASRAAGPRPCLEPHVVCTGTSDLMVPLSTGGMSSLT